MNRLKDKVAIITGATSVGIGRETALRLSSEGAFLTITGRNEEEGQEEHGDAPGGPPVLCRVRGTRGAQG